MHPPEDRDVDAELREAGVGKPSKFPHFTAPSNVREKPLHHPNTYTAPFLGPQIFPQPRPGKELFPLPPGKSLGSMEQYRLETIEMTDLGQNAEWSQEMQKLLAEDKLHEHHTANEAGMGGGAAPEYGGHRRRGGAGGGDAGAGDDAAAAGQGAAGNINAGAVTAVGGGPPKAFIMHHTGGRGTAAGVQATLRQRGLGVQYVMDREGNITRIGGPGSRHILSGKGVGVGLNNRNVVGMEVIAKNDADVTPAQVAAAKRFIQKYYPNTPVYGHGEVNPGHKEATEGLTITRAIRNERRTGGDSDPVTRRHDPDAASAPALREPDIANAMAARHHRRHLFHPHPHLETPSHEEHPHHQLIHRRPENPYHRGGHAMLSHHPKSQPKPYSLMQRRLRERSSGGTPTPPSRSFAGVQGLAGSPSGSAPERP
jgi:hypothetical protein